MTAGPRPGGAPPSPPRPADPRPPTDGPVWAARMERIARIAASPLITEAPPLSEAQRERLARLLDAAQPMHHRLNKAA